MVCLGKVLSSDYQREAIYNTNPISHPYWLEIAS